MSEIQNISHVTLQFGSGTFSHLAAPAISMITLCILNSGFEVHGGLAESYIRESVPMGVRVMSMGTTSVPE